MTEYQMPMPKMNNRFNAQLIFLTHLLFGVMGDPTQFALNEPAGEVFPQRGALLHCVQDKMGFSTALPGNQR